jgi:hypothetical protein
LLSFCDNIAKTSNVPILDQTENITSELAYEKVTERNENSEESPVQPTHSADLFNMSRVESQH